MVKLKDENAPKRPLSGYFTWMGENREAYKEKFNGKIAFKEITKKLAEGWKALSDDERATYNKTSQAAMKEWKVKFAEYKKTPEYAAFQEKKEAADAGKKFKMKKFKKDPNQPKRPATGFFMYLADMREEVKASFPPEDRNKVTEITKVISTKWKELGEDGQNVYKARSAKAKKEWDEKMVEYKKTDQYEEYQAAKREHMRKQREKAKAAQKKKSPKKRKAVKKQRVLESESDATSDDSDSEST